MNRYEIGTESNLLTHSRRFVLFFRWISFVESFTCSHHWIHLTRYTSDAARLTAFTPHLRMKFRTKIIRLFIEIDETNNRKKTHTDLYCIQLVRLLLGLLMHVVRLSCLIRLLCRLNPFKFNTLFVFCFIKQRRVCNGIPVVEDIYSWKESSQLAKKRSTHETSTSEFSCVCDINNGQLLKLLFIGDNISLRFCFAAFSIPCWRTHLWAAFSEWHFPWL